MTKEICLRQKIWKWRHVDIYDVMTLFRFFAKFGAIWKSVLLLNEKTIYTEFVSWFWKLALFSTKVVDISNIWAWYRNYFLSNNIGLVSKYLCKIWSTYHLWLGRQIGSGKSPPLHSTSWMSSTSWGFSLHIVYN